MPKYKSLLTLVAAVVSMAGSSVALAQQAPISFKAYIPGLRVVSPATPTPGGSPAPVVSKIAATSTSTLSFNNVSVGSSGTRSVLLLNVGNSSFDVTGFNLSGSSKYTIESNNCPATLPAGANCAIEIRFSPTDSSRQQGTLTFVTTASGPSPEVALDGMGQEGQGMLTANAGVAFGEVALGSVNTKSFTFRNTGATELRGLSGYVEGPASLTLSGNTCGTTTAPVSLATNQTCSITVQWAPTEASALSGAKVGVSGSFEGNPGFLILSGTAGDFTSAGAWSGSSTAATAVTTNFGPIVPGSTQDQFYFLRNTGQSGKISPSFTLSGDTTHFRIVSVTTAAAATAGLQSCAATINPAGTSTTTCATNDVKGGTYPHVRVQIRYAPQQAGFHSVSLTASSSTGANMPEPLAIVGNALFDVTGEWSSTAGSTTALTPTQLSFGSLTVGSSATKQLFLRSQGAAGNLSASFQLEGDTSNFRIVSVVKQTNNAASSTVCGSTISADGTTSTGCPADNVSGGAYPHIKVTVEYKPLVAGEHSVTLKTTPSNPSITPGPITLTGAGLFNAEAVWSSSPGTTVSPSESFLGLGTVTVGSTTERIVYARNIGTQGGLNLSFRLTGDVGQFKIISVSKQSPNSPASNVSCGATVAANGGSSTPCPADDIASAVYPHIRVLLRYSPTVAGSHQVSLESISNNATAIPAPLIFTAKADPLQAVGTITPLTDANYGQVATGTIATRSFRFTNTGNINATGVHPSVSGSPYLSIDAGGTCGTAAAPVILTPNSSCTVTVRYSPTTDESLAGLLTFVSNAVNSPTSIELTGSSVAPAAATIATFGGYKGWSDGSLAQSCNQYRNPTSGSQTYTGATGDGVYRIQPPSQSARNVYCDMTTLGGGWTLVAHITSTSVTPFAAGVNQTGDLGNFTPMPGDTLSKVSDSFWASIPGSYTRFTMTSKSAPNTFYVRYNGAPWTTGMVWNRGNDSVNPQPSCSADTINWANGRRFHIADCFNTAGLGTWSLGFMAISGYRGMGFTGGSTGYTGGAWVK